MEIYIYGGIGLFILFILILVLVKKKRLSNESEVHREIGESDSKKDYYVITNILFHDGIRQAKIDHLIVNTSGIHSVLEYQYEGKIKGNKEDEKWSFEHKGVSESFNNPIKTARALKLSIDKVLKKDYPLFFYIVFPKHTEFRKQRVDIPVLHSSQLQDELNQNFKSKKKISSNDVKSIYDLFSKIKKD